MAKKSFSKFLSLLLAVSMLVSAFMCLSAVTVSAAGTTPDLVTFNCQADDWAGLKYTKGWSTIPAGDYKATINLKILSGEMPLIRVGNDQTGTQISGYQTNIVSSYDAENYLYTITFTLSSAWEGNLGFYVTNYGEAGNFAVANPAVYLLDGNGDPTGNSLVNTFASDYYSTSRSGNKWLKAGASLMTMSAIPSGYFDSTTPGGDDEEYDDGDSKMTRFVSGTASYLHYYNSRTLSAEVYELGFDWKTVYGSGAYLEFKVGGETLFTSTTGVESVDNELDGGAMETYDAATGKRYVRFALDEDVTGLEIKIGASDGTTSMYVAKPYLKLFDGDYTTGVNLINDITESTLVDIGSNTGLSNPTSTNKIWNRENGYNSPKVKSVRLLDYNVKAFNGSDLSQRVSFNGYTWRLLRYHDYYDAGIVAGTEYMLVLDYRKFSETNLDVIIKVDGTAVADTGMIDIDNRKLYKTFTAGSNGDALEITIGNQGNEGVASIGHIGLYATDGSGNITGQSLIDDMDLFTLDWTYSSTEYDRVWNTRGYGSNNDGIYHSSIPSGYFSANTATDKAVYFPAGQNGYQVLAYKDADFCIPAGTYRLSFNYKQIAGEASVLIWTGTDIGDSVTTTSDTMDGTVRTIEFTLANRVRGLGIMLGNYDAGTDVAAAFANPTLYALVDGEPVGQNLIEPLNDNTASIRGGITRANAENARWSGLNYGSGNIKLGDVDDYFGVITNSGTPQMVAFPTGFSWQCLRYDDFALAFEAGKTYEFTINTKVISGTPTIGFFTENSAQISASANRDEWFTAYSDTTVGSVRTIRFTMLKTANEITIRIGNYSDNCDVSAVFANPRLVEIGGTSENLIADMTTDSLVISSAKNRISKKWCTTNYSGNGTTSCTLQVGDIPSDYFTAPTAKMFYLSGATTGSNIITTTEELKPDTTYTLEFDWKAYAGAVPQVTIQYVDSGASKHTLTQTALAANSVDGVSGQTFQSLDQGTVLANTSGTLGHYAVSFTMPADARPFGNGLYNFSLSIAGYIKDWDYFHYGRGSMYFGNFELKENGSNINCLLNGDLSAANEVKLGDSNQFAAIRWGVGVSQNNGSRDLYRELRVLNQPANFFTLDGPTAEKSVELNGGSYDYIRQTFLLESNTTYRLTYKAAYVNAISSNFIQQINPDSEYTSVSATTSFDDETCVKTVEFTTGSLRETFNNVVIAFFIGRNGNDVSFRIGDVKLYKVVNGSTVGANLVNNGGFNLGEEVVLDNLANETNEVRYIDDPAMIGWEINGYYSLNNNITVAEIDENSFPPVSSSAALQIATIRRIILGLQDATYSASEDLHEDDIIDVRDFVAAKKSASASDENPVDAVAAEWKSTYLNGNNTTDLQALANANLLATPVTGTIYYVDGTNGKDSNNGRSAGSAWQTLSKVNSASLQSGDAVLFKCGEVFRAAKGNSAVLSCKAGVTYGSYGSGEKPIIVGSLYNYKNRTWTNEGGNIWYTNIQNSGQSGTHSCDDVGLIAFNYGSSTGNMVATKAELAKNGDYWNRDSVGGSDGGNGYVYLYCTSNPSTYYQSIEITQKRDVIGLNSGVTVNNLYVKYGGSHGIASGSGTQNCYVSNCRVSLIGGSHSNDVKYGNCIQIGMGGSNIKVVNCYTSDAYDTGLTFQSWGGTTVTFENITFENNLVENCCLGFEWFSVSDSVIRNINVTNNIFRGAGYGWGYDQRPDYNMVTLFRGGAHNYYYNLSNFNVTGNTFDRSRETLVYWWWNDNGTADEDRIGYQPGFYAANNNYYQAPAYSNRTQTTNIRSFEFMDEWSIESEAISTYGLMLGVQKFENTDTPTGTVQYLPNNPAVAVR